MKNEYVIGVALAAGVVAGFAAAIFVAQQRIKRLPWWKKLLLRIVAGK